MIKQSLQLLTSLRLKMLLPFSRVHKNVKDKVPEKADACQLIRMASQSITAHLSEFLETRKTRKTSRNLSLNFNTFKGLSINSAGFANKLSFFIKKGVATLFWSQGHRNPLNFQIWAKRWDCGDLRYPGEPILFIERECIEFIYCQYCPVCNFQHTPILEKNGNTLPRVGMNWKKRPPRQLAPLGPRDCLRAPESGGVFSKTPLLSAVQYYNVLPKS